MSRVVTIIQARLGSSRLPGKCLHLLAGKPVLQWVVERVSLSRLHGEIVIATSEKPQDDPIEAWCKSVHLPCFRGSEKDVLDRYYQCAKQYQADVIVRVTADSPLLDPRLLDTVIETHLERKADYVLIDHLPAGIGQETISFEALERSCRDARSPAEREHVILYVQHRPQQFAVYLLEPPAGLSLSHWRITLDTERDYTLFTRLFEMTAGAIAAFSAGDIVALIDRTPDLRELAAGKH